MILGYNEMGMRGAYPPGVRGMHVPQQPGAYPGMATSGAGSPGAHPGQGFPPGQYPQQRHPSQQFMDPIRAQVCLSQVKILTAISKWCYSYTCLL